MRIMLRLSQESEGAFLVRSEGIMDTEHTPWPWTKCDEQILAADGEMIAVCYEMEDGTDDRVNAALIVHSVNIHADLVAALRKASQLASVAGDWNLDEVEIDGEMIRTFELQEQFDALLAKATS